ncbi:hypothetical protein [Acidovorax sp. SUPP2539]|uniref:hypothetical protein n=1 Tax=Acidovorax sp. SUPP2539 TaxID=2920878 RepID=UPI0023DE6AE8|nr:hypothetical protein [Acidovorax sp. SUPP2539]GKS92632.1 hypothetical protein AVTE2539_24725 [Acidovorax sp. SUPP2539]
MQTKMNQYFWRLLFHGSKLLLRVFMIFLPVIAGAFWNLIRQGPGIASASEARSAFSMGRISASELNYYENIYGD